MGAVDFHRVHTGEFTRQRARRLDRLPIGMMIRFPSLRASHIVGGAGAGDAMGCSFCDGLGGCVAQPSRLAHHWFKRCEPAIDGS